jgi:exodeoxyribonuclease V alpha subunit
MTIHKSQGSEYNKVCMMLSTKLNPVLTKELVYTGITRAKKHVSIYSDKKVFLDACGRRVLRESGLTERL